MFGIVQGGMHLELREESLNFMSKQDFDGIALGGPSVGEPKEEKTKILKHLAPLLPEDKPHYVMGVGTPEELVEGVRYELICLIVLFLQEMQEILNYLHLMVKLIFETRVIKMITL